MHEMRFEIDICLGPITPVPEKTLLPPQIKLAKGVTDSVMFYVGCCYKSKMPLEAVH